MDESEREKRAKAIQDAFAELVRPHVEDELLPAIDTIIDFLHEWYGEDINGFDGVVEALKQFLIDKFEEHRD